MGLAHDLYLSRRPLAGFVAIGIAWSTYFAQMPVIKAQVGASDGAYGMAILLASLGAIAAMWLAPLFQRLFNRIAVSVGIAIVALGMLTSGTSATLMLLVGGMALASIGSGIVDVLVNARVSDLEARHGRSLMNLNHALYSFAYAGAALATGALREARIGTVTVFVLLSAALLILALAARDRVAEMEDPALPDIPGEMPHAVVLLVGLVVLTAFLAEAAAEGWSALHLERTLGGTAGEGALGPAALGLMMGIGRLFGHSLSRLMRDTRLMLLATLLSAAGIGLAGLAPNVPVALLGFAIGGLGISVVAPLALGLLGRLVPPDVRLAAISRASVLGYGAFFFGPPLMGLVAEGFGLRAAFVVVAGILCLTAVSVLPALARRSTMGQGGLSPLV
ncbi:Inner membrane protein YbjJ [Sulfitobacter sp. THAF37]|uniref:MFS transporter n=1 Tax=Sulfitobacter sp. THAF37 TaxID=2587855 RepID=UPI001267FC16|nr:MFS transporter [Sulfitobacter sp. THAF37]QFT59033.1 Inner membrane protein YbjJ [Sulfitobacter sp. THAF37]